MGQPVYDYVERDLVKSFQELAVEQHGEEYSADSVVEKMNMNLLKALGVDRKFSSEQAFQDAFQNLNKAIANESIAGYADATALRLENLDDVMTQVLYQESNLVLWNFLERVISKQPVFEWNRKKRYGGGRRSPGFVEGGTPKTATGAYERNTIQTRYLGVRRGITHQLITTQLLGGLQIDATTEEEKNGTLDLLGIVERWLIHGKASIKAAGGATINYDGILKLMDDALTAGDIDSRNVIDKGGDPLTFEDFENAAITYRTVGKLNSTENLGVFLHPKVAAGLSQQKLPAERASMTTEVSQGKYVSGVPLAGFKTGLGVFSFRESIFLEDVEDDSPLTDAADVEPTAPAAPATTSAAAAASVGADFAGTYYWSAAAFNDGGESLITVDVSSQVIAVDEKGVITIARVTDAHGYRLYRGLLADGSDHKHVATIPQPSSGNASYDDTNSKIPGTHVSLILSRDTQDLVIAQMAPLIKFPLAPTSTTLEFLLLLYHVLVLKAAERQIVFKNVGSYLEAA